MLGLEKTPDKNREKVKLAMMGRIDKNKDGKVSGEREIVDCGVVLFRSHRPLSLR